MLTHRRALSLALVMLLGAPLAAVAQEAPPGPAASPAKPAPGAPTAAAAASIRRDPAGVKGISPFWEAIEKGDRAYLAREHDAALAAYADAIKAQPKNPVGPLRVAQVHLAKAELAEAEAAYTKALELASKDARMRGKVLFLIADLRERQRATSGVRDAWAAYAKHLAESGAKGYPNTAADRKQRAEAWMELVERYAEVKKRIELRQNEADEKLKQSSK